ncbi:unnamed protein product [Haemonchus placei]|uniref:Reverse transcriptase domain-containing protein n=1 Tax=Haemonchus placei TaxID=6290 RepID=A0A0N4X7B8_HAEPC|nr:unnamed protein product [Haemonchus placei]
MKNNLIPMEQHGFISSASTVTLMADCVFDWNLAVNEGKGVDIIYFDLTKAFDKVSHEKLLLKLQQLGIECNILSWIQSYLEDRHMCVRVGNSFSQRFHCSSGVPQGGVLSPLLFVAYTYDLLSYLYTHPSIRIKMYADDIGIYGVYNNDNHGQIIAMYGYL